MYKNLSPGAVSVNPAELDLFPAAKAAGFDGIDVDFTPMMQGESAAHFLKRYSDAGLRIGSWGLPVPVYGQEEAYNEGIENLKVLAKLAASIGAERCATWILPCSDIFAFADNFQYHVDKLKPCAEILAENGCRLGLEFIGPRTFRQTMRHEFVCTMKGMLELGKAIGTGNIGLLLDSWHLYTSHSTAAEIEELSDADIVVVHINDAPAGIDIDEQVDNVRALPGETGVIDLVGFLRALDKIGYTGPVTPEPFSAKLKEMSSADALAAAGESLDQVWLKAFG